MNYMYIQISSLTTDENKFGKNDLSGLKLSGREPPVTSNFGL